MAHISKFPSFQKIGSYTLNHNKSKTLWSFIPCVSPEKRKKTGSHIYLITINDHVKKLGCSVTPLGNCAGYGVGNAGRPSDRTTGIHYYIAKHLTEGLDVAFYAMMCPKIEIVPIKNLFGKDSVLENVYIDPKQIETSYLKDYKQTFGNLPDWNMQEKGRDADWPDDIKSINQALCTKKNIAYELSHQESPYLMLYHWKYNDIALADIVE